MIIYIISLSVYYHYNHNSKVNRCIVIVLFFFFHFIESLKHCLLIRCLLLCDLCLAHIVSLNQICYSDVVEIPNHWWNLTKIEKKNKRFRLMIVKTKITIYSFSVIIVSILSQKQKINLRQWLHMWFRSKIRLIHQTSDVYNRIYETYMWTMPSSLSNIEWNALIILIRAMSYVIVNKSVWKIKWKWLKEKFIRCDKI